MLHTRLSTDFGFLPQLVFLLGPLIETALLCPSQPKDSPDWWEHTNLLLDGGPQSHYEMPAYLYSYQQETKPCGAAPPVPAAVAADPPAAHALAAVGPAAPADADESMGEDSSSSDSNS